MKTVEMLDNIWDELSDMECKIRRRAKYGSYTESQKKILLTIAHDIYRYLSVRHDFDGLSYARTVILGELKMNYECDRCGRRMKSRLVHGGATKIWYCSHCPAIEHIEVEGQLKIS